MSTITLINETDEVVRLAIFRRPVVNPTLASVAWRVAAPPPGGQQTITIANEMQVFAQYSSRAEEPTQLDCRTNIVPFSETTARFVITGVMSQDQRSNGAQVEQRFDDLVLNEVRVVNYFSIGCLVSITLDGDPLYAPQVLWPGGLFTEDVRGGFYIAVVAQFVSAGGRLIDEEISLTQTALLEGGTVTVRGSQWTGYSLTTS